MIIHPTWATKYKKKGTELRLIKGRYYLYEVSSKWDAEKKRSKKITGKLLGKITESDGFIESDKAKLRKREMSISHVSVKEYGVSAFLDSQLCEYTTLLQNYFPDHWQIIIALAYGRFVHHSPLKNMEYHYLQSYLSVLYPNLPLSPKSLTGIMRDIGARRMNITQFFKEFSKADDNILFDGTDLLTDSKKMGLPHTGKSKKGTFESLANTMFIFSVGLQLPIYYRLLPGNIKDIKAFKLCLEESQISDAVVIADKGFFSHENIQRMETEQLKFIIPLHRNNSRISYDIIQSADKRHFDGFFKYEGRIIWYYQIQVYSHTVCVFLDEERKTQEIKDYLDRIEKLPEKYTSENFLNKQYIFGTIALLHNLEKSPQEIYVDYKSRGQIETMIDTLKNILDADRSYMQNEQALEAWMFINFIALQWYYKICRILAEKGLTPTHTPMDLILFLKGIRKVKINETWYTAEMTKKTAALLNTLNIHIT